MTTSTPTTTVVVPGTHVMTALVGPRDRYLRHIEQQFPTVQISVRGNEVRISGDLESDVAGVASLFEELSTLLQGGQQLDDVTLDRVVAMVQASERPSEILSHQVLRGAKGRQVKPKTAGQKRYLDTIAENVIGSGGHRQVVARGGDGGPGAPGQGGPTDHPHPAGRRGRRTIGVPPR
jgi:phosphate starvation-inducible PhoH-like protein